MITDEGIKYSSGISKKDHMFKQKSFSGINVAINHARIKMLNSKNICYNVLQLIMVPKNGGAEEPTLTTVLSTAAHLNGFLL